jgi:arylsulfatase A
MTSIRILCPTLLVALPLIQVSSSQESATSSAAPRPNIIVVFTDDQGYGDLSSQGHPTIRTPHIDRLAAGGIKFTQFYVGSPVCSPSRAALLTGCYPKRIGMQDHVIFPGYNYGLHTDEVTIADALGEAGYATGCFGKWHLGHRPGLLPLDQGFDTYFGVPYSNDMAQYSRPTSNEYKFRLPLMRDNEVVEWEPDQRDLTRRYTEEAARFIDEHHEQPFFVYLPHSMPHIPLAASGAFGGTSKRGLYGDVIEEIDWSVGTLVAALERNGVLDNTLIVFTSDNGPWLSFKEKGGSAGILRGGKGTNWEGGQRVPFIASWPGGIPAGQVTTEVATAMDLLPTFAALGGASLSTERPVDGHDISALLAGEVGATSPTSEFLYYTSHGELAGIRRGPWKLLLASGELFHVEYDVSEQWSAAGDLPELVAELEALARERDRELAANARPVRTVSEILFDPAKPK